MGDYIFKCKECGKEFIELDKSKQSYCPYCGSKELKVVDWIMS